MRKRREFNWVSLKSIGSFREFYSDCILYRHMYQQMQKWFMGNGYCICLETLNNGTLANSLVCLCIRFGLDAFYSFCHILTRVCRWMSIQFASCTYIVYIYIWYWFERMIYCKVPWLMSQYGHNYDNCLWPLNICSKSLMGLIRSTWSFCDLIIYSHLCLDSD